MDKKLLRGLIIGVVSLLIIVFVFGKVSNKFGSSTPTGDFLEVEQSNQLTEDLNNLNQEESEKVVIEEYNNLLLDILDLRENYIDSNIIQTAELVTEFDKEVASLNNNPISDNWETITLSLAKKTADNDNFLDFILTVALEGDKIGLSDGDLIVDILTANKYWNTDHTVKFSQSLTSSNKAITDISDEALSSKWDEIIECDGSCTDKANLIFEIIRLIVE